MLKNRDKAFETSEVVKKQPVGMTRTPDVVDTHCSKLQNYSLMSDESKDPAKTPITATPAEKGGCEVGCGACDDELCCV